MPITIITIIYAVLIFCLLIFVHELGHFAVAKAVGIRVNEFSLGMGPRILRFGKGETDYSLRAFPIGGFVKMEGEDEDSDDPRAFNNKSAIKRALVVVAGSMMNLLTTVIIVTIMALVFGSATNVIGETTKGFPAEEAGLRAGDRIVRINETEVSEWGEVIAALSESKGETIELLVERSDEKLTIVSKVKEDKSGRRIIGITTKAEHSVPIAIKTGFVSSWNLGKQMIQYIGVLFTGGGSVKDLVGPVGIVSIINDNAKLGFVYIANFAALISLNLGIVNLLPFPALDGGRLLFLLIRKFTGKAITDEMEGKIHFAGLMLLFGLMIYLVFQDVGRFIIK
ncbi:MAG: RIP metalloprotease RseP [Eubacteriales bacterium]|nr:RIP metalloprotease RseP [Eubacteriales bacterium]